MEFDREIVKKRYGQSREIEYWRELNPELKIEAKVFDFPCYDFTDRKISEIDDQMKADGWTRLPDLFPTEEVEKLRLAVERIYAEGWLPTYCFLYDDFWRIFRSNSIIKYLQKYFGSEFVLRNRVWCNYVETLEGSSGWRPHTDNSPNDQLTIWIPLTEANPDNGCIQLIPSSRVDDRIQNVIDRNESSKAELTWGDVKKLLQNVQTVPASPGSAYSWQKNVLHWSSQTNRNALKTRISIGVEFQEKAKKNNCTKIYQIDDPLPTFKERLALISFEVADYLSRFEKNKATPERLALAHLLKDI